MPAPPRSATVPPKRGIYYGWWIVISGLVANIAWAEQFNSSFGAFVQHVGADMSWGRTALAGVQTVARLPEAGVPIFLGAFVDRHGSRWLIAAGGVLMSLSFMALATIDELWQLYLYKGLFMAIGAACIGGFTSVTVANWFVEKRGRAIGIVVMGTSLAGLFMPLLGAFMIERWGWRQAWFTMGLLILPLTLPAMVFFRRRPEDLGMTPDGVDPATVSVSASRAPDEKSRRREELLAADVVWTRGELLRTPVMWLLVYSWGMAQLGIAATNLHLIPFLTDLGHPLTLAAAAVSLRSLVMLIANPIWGFIAERVPIKVAASGQFSLQATAMLLLMVYPSGLGLIAALVTYGLGNGGSLVLQDTSWANYYGRISLGALRSVAYPFQTSFTALGPVVVGLLYDLTGSYQAAWLALLCGFVLAGILMAFLRPPARPIRKAASLA